MKVSTRLQAYLTRETGGSGPLFLKSHQPFRERHQTPLAIPSGHHFENLSTHSSFLKINFGRELFEKQAPFSDDTSIYTPEYVAGNLFLIIVSESGNIVKISNEGQLQIMFHQIRLYTVGKISNYTSGEADF